MPGSHFCSSSLAIFRRGEKIGFCHWVTSAGEAFAKLDEAPPAGMVGNVGGYPISFDGNLALAELANRGRFECLLKFSAKQDWEEATRRVSLRPQTRGIHSVAAEQTVSLRAEDARIETQGQVLVARLVQPGVVCSQGACGAIPWNPAAGGHHVGAPARPGSVRD